MGPQPVLLSRKEVDALYETLEAVVNALKGLKVNYIVTGGSLLGAIRQHSILFCDDDIDMAIIDYDGTIYERVVAPKLQDLLGNDFLYQIRPWEGGDRVRPKRMNNVFLDLFVLRKYSSMEELKELIGVKKNGEPQSESYVQGILDKMESAAFSQNELLPLCPFWHFNTRKAVEMWTKEVYREEELFPLCTSLKMGPVTGILGPRAPVRLCKRAFGTDCFEVYYQSASHKTESKPIGHHREHHRENGAEGELPPLISAGGTWEGGQKAALEDQHYLPMQPIARAARRPTLHNKERLFDYITEQSRLEEDWFDPRPKSKTVYMDGVFDLFHIGHLEAIKQCAKLGDRVIIGVTGDKDAEGYKRLPIVPERERSSIIKALKVVDAVVCPCPLVVTEEFMEEYGIDLVVHGFANDADAKLQEKFFEIPVQLGKFQRISYYNGLSTTERIQGIKGMLGDEHQGENTSETAKPTKPQWFGATVAAATNNAEVIPSDPFPLKLRQAIESHIRKATKRRKEALEAIRDATGEPQYNSVMAEFKRNLGVEGEIQIDPKLLPIRSAFLKSVDLPDDYDLSRIHEFSGAKDELLHKLTKKSSCFQETFDMFVRSVCAPQLASKYDCKEIYYQAFPCLRIVQPNEFSIGPHADVAYGHHPCSINFYLPLTKISGASALFLESRPGSEDWHPISAEYGK